LTTLFPEVRVRGFFELRGVDALPRRWRGVPVVLLAGLLYDDRARGQARGVLARHRRFLPRLLRRAVYGGMVDPALCALAVETWSFALAGATRLPAGFVPAAALRTAEAFLDRYTLRGRCPSDELREQLAISPAAALAWATEPVDTPAIA
jgi:glutamate--cysteine ligase